MANKIQIKRGTLAQIKAAPRDIAEPVYATDTKDLYIGNASGGDTLFLSAQNTPYNKNQQSIINGNFDVWQRGESFTNPVSGAFLADRWQLVYGALSTYPTITAAKLATGGGVDGSNSAMRFSFSGAGGGAAGDRYYISQKIENGMRLSGSKITVSFRAKSSISGKKVGVWGNQNYGTGGSPSASENVTGANVTLTTSWAEYSVTLTIPTLSGKSYGTNGDDYLNIIFNLMWGTGAYADVVGSTGVAEGFKGAGTVDITQVQVSAGESKLPFQPKSYAEELALCKRYCHVITDTANAETPAAFGFAATGLILFAQVTPPVEMRTPPTLLATAADWKAQDGINSAVLTSLLVQSGQNGRSSLTLRAEVAAGLTQFRPYVITANSVLGKKLILDAEL